MAAKNWAIIIGINNYSFMDKLNFAKTDAEAMHRWLGQQGGFDPKGLFLFTDDSLPIPTNPPIFTQPTFGHLDSFFDIQFEQKLLTSADNLWFFFSGHGNRGTGGDYLMLSDSNPRRLENTALCVSYITERLRNWGAGNVVMFIDACRNRENQAKGETITPQDYQGIITFYSCRDREKSLEIQSHQRGAFTHVLLQALQETKEQNGCLTVGKLEQYLMREVPKLSPNQHPLARVEPTYKSNFILFGDAQEGDIKSLKSLGYQKGFEGKKEEAREVFFHANMAAKGGDFDIINALGNLQNSRLPINYETPPTKSPLEPKKPEVFEFQTPTVNRRGKVVNTETKQASYFTEDLGNGVTLKMVAIPDGTFMMGTEDEEIERLVKKFDWEWYRTEKPQHEVTVQPFYMGKYQITQVQWKAVAKLPKVNRDLKLDPSYFKGDNLPVEQVSWYDAVEFCDRLSKYTGKQYRLPSEAEWEYACRAGTTTPFHFGETITGELANYCTSSTFADESEGEYREKTTTVGQFPPNAFGLYDMHGNVWEWCLDDWHANYENAPKDGSAWFDENNNLFQKTGIAVLRGGSWVNDPENCRSAYRNDDFGAVRYLDVNDGFRVVCAVGRIFQ